MKKTIYRILVFSLIIAMLSGFAVPAYAATSADSIGSLLDSFQNVSDQVFNLNSRSRIYVPGEQAPTGTLLTTVQLVQRQFAADGHEMPIVWGPEDRIHDGDIVINLNSGCGLIADGYQWEVGTVAKLTAPDTDGILYGMNTLQKMVRACGSSIQGFTAKDEPDTRERTVQLDVARKYFTKDWICNFIREMSWMGYNTLSLHFSEDGGFRADIWDENYYVEGKYMPENDFSWLVGSKIQYWVHSPYNNDPDADRVLSASELIEIINLAKLYHIEIIPNFDSPSHMDYLTWKFEQYYQSHNDYTFTYNGKTYSAKDAGGCISYTGVTGEDSPTAEYKTIDIRGETDRGAVAKAFVFSIYEDIAAFFKYYAGSSKFGIGADEVNLSYANAWDYSQFPAYINELNSLLNSKGYTVRMYNDFIRDGYLNQFAKNIQIQYWNSPFSPYYGANHESSILSVEKMVDDGRTLFNCIQTNTYFVLRVANSSATSTDTSDARSADCRNWTFYHSDEDSIYNEWYPADISEHGDQSENVEDVPSGQLGGGYFLLWNDYASVATESEVWNGVANSGKWNVIDRMWSNIIKMWNSDVNNTVDYNSYAAVRSKFGYFPGYASCSVYPSNLPRAISAVKASLADHSALNTALQDKAPAEGYSGNSYAMYEAAYVKAESLNKNADATAEEMEAAIAALEEAKRNLVLLDQMITIYHKTKVNNKEILIQTDEQTYENGSFNVYIPKITGYTYLSCEGATYTPLDSDDGSGHISGSSTKAVTVTIWYENTPYTGKLGNLVEEALTDEETYTSESWTVYQKAMDAAKAFAPTETTTQADIDKLVKAIVDAQNALVAAPVEFSGVLTVEKLTALARLGRQVGLRITTTADIEKLTIDGETFTLCAGCVTTLKSGETVKLWIVYFPADEAGTFTYKLHAGKDVEEFSVTVQ